MDILKALQNGQSKKQTLAIVKDIESNPSTYTLLVKLLKGDDKVLSQRAAWPLSDASLLFPDLVKPHIPVFVKLLLEDHHHPAVYRNLLRILEYNHIPETYHGRLLDRCFEFIRDPARPEAIRAFSITLALTICRPYPELRRELCLVLLELKELEPKPAVMVRSKRALKELQSTGS